MCTSVFTVTTRKRQLCECRVLIDGGDTWLPVLYMLDQADIIAVDDGTVGAEATLNAAHGGVALVNNILFQDDDEIWDMEPLEEALGGSYGAFIGAEIDARSRRTSADGWTTITQSPDVSNCTGSPERTIRPRCGFASP